VKGQGAAASTFAELVSRVEALQQKLCAEAQPGLKYERLHERSHQEVGRVLTDLKIAKMSADEAVSTGLTRAFYPHGLGHSLGLQTHDVGCGLRAPRPDNAFLRNTSEVTPGQVVTIEPGVYFIEALLAPARQDPRLRGLVDWTTVDALAPLGGVRIEDDVLVLAAGVRNLTREHLPEGGGAVD
jgi:Xaa-Pro dipeptidase